MSVVDYDARRALAAANVAAEVQTVRSFVSKFTKAQRAAEQTLDMWDTPIRSVRALTGVECAKISRVQVPPSLRRVGASWRERDRPSYRDALVNVRANVHCRAAAPSLTPVQFCAAECSMPLSFFTVRTLYKRTVFRRWGTRSLLAGI